MRENGRTRQTKTKGVERGFEIGAALRKNPDLLHVEVSGHTDNVGPDERNLRLSQGRAEAVVAFLVDMEKIDPSRLTPIGYGETVPVDTNATEEGKGNNRRVEFVLRPGVEP